MKTKKKMTLKFYQNLGKLFYAIAAADKEVRDEEFDKACYNAFTNYKKEQPHLFTANIKKLILKTAHAIAASFSGLNKSELIILAKLDIELKK